MTRRRMTVCLAVIALVAMTAAPAAAQYPPEGPTAGVGSTTVSLGGQVTVTGSGWRAGSQVTITLLSNPRTLGTAQVDQDGTFSTTVTVPSDVPPGRHTLRLSGTGADGTPRTVDTRLQVKPAAPPDEAPPEQQPPALAATGMNSGLGAAAGLGLLVAGAGALLLARRRQARQQG